MFKGHKIHTLGGFRYIYIYISYIVVACFLLPLKGDALWTPRNVRLFVDLSDLKQGSISELVWVETRTCAEPSMGFLVGKLGRNSAPVEVGSFSHYLQGFVHPRWLFRISSINSTTWLDLIWGERWFGWHFSRIFPYFRYRFWGNHILFQPILPTLHGVCVCVCVNQGQRGGKHHVSFKIPIGSMGQTVYLPTNLPMEKQAFM